MRQFGALGRRSCHRLAHLGGHFGGWAIKLSLTQTSDPPIQIDVRRFALTLFERGSRLRRPACSAIESGEDTILAFARGSRGASAVFTLAALCLALPCEASAKGNRVSTGRSGFATRTRQSDPPKDGPPPWFKFFVSSHRYSSPTRVFLVVDCQPLEVIASHAVRRRANDFCVNRDRPPGRYSTAFTSQWRNAVLGGSRRHTVRL
jgi:hypothetical protein